GQAGTDPAIAELAGAPRRAARPDGQADPSRTRQAEERHQREGATRARLGTAFARGSHHCHRGKPVAARASEGKSGWIEGQRVKGTEAVKIIHLPPPL